MMKLRALSVCGVIGLALLLGRALALTEATVRPFDWPPKSTFEYAILDSAGKRVASAYYRVLQESLNGTPVFHFKYVGRNDQMSEASECWVHADTMLPVRSTRKVVSGGRTFFLDVTYKQGVIVAKRKFEGQEPGEMQLPAPGPVYDYESLMWLVPQIDFAGDKQAKLNLYSTLNEVLTTVVVNDGGEQQVVIAGKTYKAHVYSFNVNNASYMYFGVLQDGLTVPGRVDMGGNSFVNLKLDPAKVKGARVKTAQPAAEKGAGAAAPPKKGEAEKPKPKEEEPPPSNPHENPLGPPPKGGKF